MAPTPLKTLQSVQPFDLGRIVSLLLKVTVHVGTDQNFEIEIFAEYKYTLNELLVKKMFFNTSNSFRDTPNENFYRK